MKNITIKHLFYAIIFLTFITSLNTCNSCSTKSSTKRLVKETDSLKTEIQFLKKNSTSKNDLIMQGLETEKRFIQATDRKMLDVQRQSEIEKQIEELKKK
jgi:hypothetical protein